MSNKMMEKKQKINENWNKHKTTKDNKTKQESNKIEATQRGEWRK